MSARLSRRTLLAGLAALPATALLGCSQDRTTAAPISTVDTLDFANQLRIPPLATSVVRDGIRLFELNVTGSSAEFLPGLSTPTLAYDDGRSAARYLGPTLRARRGERVRVRINNRLPETTTVHWHGMHLPATQDGGPHQAIPAGGEWAPEWLIDQPAATLWYHPHPHGQTERQVNQGLAGLFYVTDEASPELPSRYGIDDIPVILQDRRFEVTGRFDLGGRSVTGYVGDTILVNGTHNPHLPVSTERVRLRILNGSSARIYHLALSDDHEFTVVATDGGFLPRPARMRRLLLSPGERAEIVVELRPGERRVLRSLPWDLGMIAQLTDGSGGNDRLDLLQLRADPQLTTNATVPHRLTTVSALSIAEVAERREIVLEGRTIDGRPMELGRIDAVIAAGSTELWTVRNAHNQPHNFHVHGVSFQIVPGEASGPDPALGWKDTVLLGAEQTVTLAIRFPSFSDPLTPYMYHCHLLWHEDEGMMAQFTVVDADQVASAPRSLPRAHDHD